MCADEDGDLLIESAVKGIPKVFAVSTLVSVMPAQPFIFRNYQVCLPTMFFAGRLDFAYKMQLSCLSYFLLHHELLDYVSYFQLFYFIELVNFRKCNIKNI